MEVVLILPQLSVTIHDYRSSLGGKTILEWGQFGYTIDENSSADLVSVATNTCYTFHPEVKWK